MNDLTSSSAQMTSLEISELVESRHDVVKKSIWRLAEREVIGFPPTVEIPTATKPTTVYVFAGEQGKRDSIIVVAQLSPEFTARLVDRWQALESGEATPAILAKQPRKRTHRPQDPVILKMKQAEAVTASSLRIYKMLGTDLPMAKELTVDRIKQETGLDFSRALANNTVDRVPMNLGDLGEKHNMTAQAVGKLLTARGFRVKGEDGEFYPTDKGKKFSTFNPYKSPNSDHTGYRLLWYPEVMDALMGETEDAA